MNLLCINGSPRTNSNTGILVEHAAKPFVDAGWTVTEFQLGKMKLSPCNACESCHRTGRCVIDDDMSAVTDAYRECDAVIIGSPVYYRNVTSQLKMLFDRTYVHRNTRPLTGKIGGAIAVGSGEDCGQSITTGIIYNYFLSNGMLCVPGEINGLTASASAPGDILKQPKRLQQAGVLGQNMLRLASKLFR
ncbi:MAG: flavodoxin family protein [Spirochaetes bacterium]|nr:flavodoxin family protein [Spirochaetota bacterium]